MHSKRKGLVDPPELPDAAALSSLAMDPLIKAYERAKIDGASLSAATGLRFESCILTRLDLERSKLPNLGMVDVRIERSSATNGNWAKPTLRRVEIVGARLTGLTIVEGDLTDVLLRECKADFLQLTATHLRNVRFEGCVLTEMDLRDSVIERVAFADCDLTGADMSQAKLKEVDLSGSRIGGLKLAANQLGALTIDPSQAMAIVRMLGVRIG